MSKRASSRRAVLGSGASMLLLSAAAAGQAKAEELDGELLGLCRQFHGLHGDACRLFEKEAEESAVEMLDRESEVWDRITDLPARSPEGLRAKAVVLRTYSESLLTDDVGRLVSSIVRDLTGAT